MKNSRQFILSILISLFIAICAISGTKPALGYDAGVSVDKIAYKYVDGNVRISISFDNPHYENEGMIICLLYDSYGKCEEIISQPVVEFSEVNYVFAPEEYKKARIFLWESMTTLKPLCAETIVSFDDITHRLTEVIFDTSGVDAIHETLPQGDMVYGTKFNLPSKDSLSKIGYVLDGFIVNGVPGTFGEEITVLEDEVRITPVFAELSTYTVEYYHQNVTDDNYTLTDKYTVDDIKVGTTVTAETKTYAGFGINNPVSMTQGEVISNGALTLKIYYDRNIITAIFDTNGVSAVSSKSGKYETEITLPTGNDVTKPSHILTGWKDINGKVYSVGEKVALTEDVTFTAMWKELSSYTVKYYQQNITDDGYTQVDAYTINDIEVGTPVTAEEKTYKGFTKSDKSVVAGQVISGGGLILNVYYDRNIITATFDTNGGSAVSSKSGKYESEITLPTENDVTKTSHILMGWEDNNGKIYSVGEKVALTEDVAFAALWKELSSYTVKYYQQNITDDGYTQVDFYTVNDIEVGTPVTAETKTYAGFGINSTVSMTQGEVISNGALTLKVYYDRNIITATFDTHGGSSVSSKSGKYESKITLPTGNDVTKPSHILTGWKDSNGKIYSVGEKVALTEDVTFTAMWKELSSYTVKYYQQNITDDGYTQVDSYTVNDIEVGTTVTAEEKTYKGFTMSDKSVVTGQVMSDGGLILGVYYDRVLVKVTFDTSGVDTINETLPQGNMPYGKKFNLPTKNSLTKNGYELTGFKVNGVSKAIGAEITVGEEEIKIIPVFEKHIAYKIEYYRQNSTLDGYTLYKTDSTKTASEGETITLDISQFPKYSGYYFDDSNSQNILSALQTKTGAVLKVYYNRLFVTVEYYRHNPYVTGYYLYQTKKVLGGYENGEFGVSNLTLPQYPDYVYNPDAAGSVLSGVATKDGLTLKIYYDLVIDEAAQSQVIYRINSIIRDLDTIGFTRDERKVLSVVISTMNNTLKDAEAGAYVFMEGYVREYYGEDVDKAKSMVEDLKTSGKFDAFKSKLGQLRANDVEYLAKAMFGIDDIEQWV